MFFEAVCLLTVAFALAHLVSHGHALFTMVGETAMLFGLQQQIRGGATP
jgi:hypothetical protein